VELYLYSLPYMPSCHGQGQLYIYTILCRISMSVFQSLAMCTSLVQGIHTRYVCLILCDLETLTIRWHRYDLGCSTTERKKRTRKVMYTTTDTGHKALNKIRLHLDHIFCRPSRSPSPACHHSWLWSTKRRQIQVHTCQYLCKRSLCMDKRQIRQHGHM